MAFPRIVSQSAETLSASFGRRFHRSLGALFVISCVAGDEIAGRHGGTVYAKAAPAVPGVLGSCPGLVSWARVLGVTSQAVASASAIAPLSLLGFGGGARPEVTKSRDAASPAAFGRHSTPRLAQAPGLDFVRLQRVTETVTVELTDIAIPARRDHFGRAAVVERTRCVRSGRQFACGRIAAFVPEHPDGPLTRVRELSA